MKTKIWIILIVLVLALCLGLSLFLLKPGVPATHAEIFSNGQLLQTVDLRIDREFTVTTESGGTNVVTVKDGKIAVTQATCPDHYCMKRGFCHSGADIVCLPNRLVISFLQEADVDFVAG